eukprot:1198317-Pyramimonas_sp.AAC.1
MRTTHQPQAVRRGAGGGQVGVRRGSGGAQEGVHANVGSLQVAMWKQLHEEQEAASALRKEIDDVAHTHTPRPMWHKLQAVALVPELKLCKKPRSKHMRDEYAGRETSQKTHKSSVEEAAAMDAKMAAMLEEITFLREAVPPPPPPLVTLRQRVKQKLDFDDDENFFVGLGSGAGVPKYLRLNGK